MPELSDKPLIIVKKKRGGGHAHHGGSWKVAYADFVTAMMAFFLLMWLLGAVPQDKLKGLQDYFQQPSAIKGPGGASTSMIKLGGTNDFSTMEGDSLAAGAMDDVSDASNETLSAAEDELDRRRLEALKSYIEKAIEDTQALEAFKDQLFIDITPEGLRIQIVDKDNRAMFDVGRALLKPYAAEILEKIGGLINRVPNKISVTGHTDARQFVSTKHYDNWELSSDRAHAARRALLAGGMDADKVGRVVGLGASVMFDKKDPLSAINRRIAIIVMNKKWERSLDRVQGVHEKAIEGGESIDAEGIDTENGNGSE